MTEAPSTIEWHTGRLHLAFSLGMGPVTLERLSLDRSASVVSSRPIVELFIAGEQRARSGHGVFRSAVGSRFRYRSHLAEDQFLVIVQSDPRTGLEVESRFAVTSEATLTVTQRVSATAEPIVLLAVTSFAFATAAPAEVGRHRLLHGDTGWLGESRWRSDPVRELLPELRLDVTAQDARGRWALVSTGAWSTGTVQPVAALEDLQGATIAWQIEATAGWLMEFQDHRQSIAIDLLGPTEHEHHFALPLGVGDEFTSVAVTVAVGADLTEAFGGLVLHRRRTRVAFPADRVHPVVYNDFMNTLMGQPTTEHLEPLIDRAAEVGADVFCIDAGWFTDDRDYWSSIGIWREAPARFRDGLPALLQRIRDKGMMPGLWIEPEIIGIHSPAAHALPPEAFFQQHGRVLVEHDRQHLDLTHPAARRHLDDAIDHIVGALGVPYVKLDYNVDPGSGSDRTGAPGASLLAHGRALREWIVDARRRHPELVIENCASGAMRADHGLLAVAHHQSTSDQQDAVRSAVIAATAPLTLAPEQAANWAYPATDMSDGELATTLVNGIVGRLYLSGFLDRLDAARLAIVEEAVAAHKRLLPVIAGGLPSWPLGVPSWDSEVFALRVDAGTDGFIAIWNRGERRTVTIPGVAVLTPLFAPADGWKASVTQGASRIDAPSGPTAAIFTRTEPAFEPGLTAHDARHTGLPQSARPSRFLNITKSSPSSQ